MCKKDNIDAKYRPLCFRCGGVLCWDSSAPRSDDENAITDWYHCLKCGTSYEITEPSEEEKEDYKEFWK